jgi:hypothetical protein
MLTTQLGRRKSADKGSLLVNNNCQFHIPRDYSGDIQDFKEKLHSMEEILIEIRVELATIKTKSKMWGAFGGIVVATLSTLAAAIGVYIQLKA